MVVVLAYMFIELFKSTYDIIILRLLSCEKSISLELVNCSLYLDLGLG